MLSVYESAPDLFNFSQSWGWKSSTMVLDDGVCGFGSEEGAESGAGRRAAGEGSRGRLRFMVVIGMSCLLPPSLHPFYLFEFPSFCEVVLIPLGTRQCVRRLVGGLCAGWVDGIYGYLMSETLAP